MSVQIELLLVLKINKRMKKFVFLVMIMFLGTSLIFAQERQRMNPEERIEKQTEFLAKQLALTAEQKEKVKEIYTQSLSERKQEMSKENREKMRAEFQKKREEQTIAIKKVLTDEQKTKYDALLKKQEEQMKSRRK